MYCANDMAARDEAVRHGDECAAADEVERIINEDISDAVKNVLTDEEIEVIAIRIFWGNEKNA